MTPMMRGPFMPGMPMMQQPGPPARMPTTRPAESSGNDDEPASKRAKTEEQLIPENEFMAHNKVGFHRCIVRLSMM